MPAIAAGTCGTSIVMLAACAKQAGGWVCKKYAPNSEYALNNNMCLTTGFYGIQLPQIGYVILGPYLSDSFGIGIIRLDPFLVANGVSPPDYVQCEKIAHLIQQNLCNHNVPYLHGLLYPMGMVTHTATTGTGTRACGYLQVPHG